ncbi:acyl-CoA thioesterase [Reinekea marinisedimentorum]|uniref:Acyl-CoA thioesterase YciA n=1 Tax=Reinekea marinisedimentorum TaxID=230495 RepID=A0A4R3HZH1_9GAMM|nr:acyl-CoA thioesterase [Reinekea marinisedimentorum]TCS38093.1 acyl-CoA thioesterase YciA [Reinekea marinisedimentorum]
MKKLDESNPEPRGELQLRVLAMPTDANPIGDISGGWLVTQMDSAASIVANRITKGRTATMAIGDMSFIRPIKVGSVVCCYAQVKSVGRSSVRISIEVWSRMPEDEERQKVTEAEFVYVAIDSNRRLRSIREA